MIINKTELHSILQKKAIFSLELFWIFEWGYWIRLMDFLLKVELLRYLQFTNSVFMDKVVLELGD